MNNDIHYSHHNISTNTAEVRILNNDVDYATQRCNNTARTLGPIFELIFAKMQESFSVLGIELFTSIVARKLGFCAL